MTWFKIVMSNEDIVSGQHMKIQNAFESLFLAAGAPKGAAMFANRDMARGDWFFFSPGAMSIAGALVLSYGGIECTSPRRDEVSRQEPGNPLAKRARSARRAQMDYHRRRRRRC